VPAVTVCDGGVTTSEKLGMVSGVTVTLAGVLCDVLPFMPTMLNEYVLAATELATDSVKVEEAGPLVIVAGFGLKLALMPLGSPVALKATSPVKPLLGDAVTV